MGETDGKLSGTVVVGNGSSCQRFEFVTYLMPTDFAGAGESVRGTPCLAVAEEGQVYADVPQAGHRR